MKLSKYIAGLLVLAAATGASCASDFLDENYKGGFMSNYLETEEGVIGNAASLYGITRYWFAYEHSYAVTSYGCDEFEVGTDNSNETWNVYNASYGPTVIIINGNTAKMESVWDEMYYGIASANLVIANADVITKAGQDVHDMVLGEGYFLRGYNYYRLCAQYGGIVLQNEPVEGVVRTFTRSSEEASLQQAIDDLENAYKLLPAQSNVQYRGRLGWTKYTAAHFLAKALLLRVSERNDAWNSAYKDSDLARIISLCDEVIAARPLAPDFRDLWNWTGVDCEAEYLPEILMAAEFNGDSGTRGRYGNEVFRYFNCQFHNNYFGSYVGNRGMWIGHNFQRLRPTEYNMMVYDKEKDSRFWKSTRTIYNKHKDDAAKQRPVALKRSADDDLTYQLDNGDPAILFICNGRISADGSSMDNYWPAEWDAMNFGVVGSSTFQYNGKDVPNAFVHYNKKVATAADNGWRRFQQYGNKTENDVVVNDNEMEKVVDIAKNAYVSISKNEDGARDNDQYGTRDGVLARVAETYLVKAEALVRQGKYQEAVDVVNILRDRAAYRAGEDRALHTDGTQAFETNSAYANNITNYMAYSKVNSYVLSTGVSDFSQPTDLRIASYTDLPKEDKYILNQLGCTSDYDRMLNFILNERTRELNGEFVRWEDLARTKTLVKRTMAFNKECAANGTLNDDHFCLRPIPQSFIDGLINEDGSPLTADQKAALQNPGF